MLHTFFRSFAILFIILLDFMKFISKGGLHVGNGGLEFRAFIR
jgi:hypothetical protein